MAEEPQVTGTTPVSSTEPAFSQRLTPPDPLELPLFRFDLQQLLWFVAALSGLMAILVSLPGLIAATLLLAVLIVSAHVLSTAIGTRLRAQTDEAQRHDDRSDLSENVRGPRGDFERHAAHIETLKRSPWHRRGSTSLPWLPRLIITGCLVGGLIGAILLTATIGHRTSAAGIVVGSVSLAVVGGWFAFLCGSFYGIFRHGLRDALAEQRKDESPRPIR
jgi:hypothetical protein